MLKSKLIPSGFKGGLARDLLPGSGFIYRVYIISPSKYNITKCFHFYVLVPGSTDAPDRSG